MQCQRIFRFFLSSVFIILSRFSHSFYFSGFVFSSLSKTNNFFFTFLRCFICIHFTLYVWMYAFSFIRRINRDLWPNSVLQFWTKRKGVQSAIRQAWRITYWINLWLFYILICGFLYTVYTVSIFYFLSSFWMQQTAMNVNKHKTNKNQKQKTENKLLKRNVRDNKRKTKKKNSNIE